MKSVLKIRPIRLSEVNDVFFTRRQLKELVGLHPTELISLLQKVPFIREYKTEIAGSGVYIYDVLTLMCLVFNRVADNDTSKEIRDSLADHFNDLLFQGFTYDPSSISVDRDEMEMILRKVVGDPAEKVLKERAKSSLKSGRDNPLDYLTPVEVMRVRAIELGISLLSQHGGVEKDKLYAILGL